VPFIDDMPTLFGYHERVELERSGLRGREAHDLLGQFASLRAEAVAWLRTLDTAIFEPAGVHAEVGLVTAEQLLFHGAYHDSIHLKQPLGMVQSHFDPLRGPMRSY
jgi:DinB superfamily